MKKLYFLFFILFTTSITFAQPANDDCVNAEVITVTNTSTNFIFDINSAVLNNETICATTSDFADVWYQFTMPFDGNIYVDGSLSWNNFALYNACGGTEIDCGIANGLFTNITSGNTYILRVYRTSSTASNTNYQNFNIKAFPTATNDDCASAENITVTTTASTVNFEVGGASVNNEIGCSGVALDYVDIWYDFTMPVNGNLYIDASINWNNIALYNACGGTLIQCGVSNQFIEGLTSGTNYKLRIFRTSSNADNSYLNFTIQAFQEATNDDCASAENITVTTTASTVNFEIGGASVNNEVGCDGNTASDYVDIWYDFTMPVNGNLYIEGSISWNNFAVYDTCTGTQIQCGASNLFMENLTSATNYKLRVFRTLAIADNNGYRVFSIQAFENVGNDNCASAENITVTTTQSTVNFEIGGASINNEVGCTGTTNDYADIWYDFTMPVNGNLYVNGSLSWNAFALYDTCNGTQIQCGSANQLFTDLTATTNYKLRVFRTLNLADNNGYRVFTIQAFEIINNDDCASAENITVTNTPTTINFGIAGASINSEVGCSGTAAEDYADIWYNVNISQNIGSLEINGNISWNNFALYEYCNGPELACFSNQGVFEGLNNEITYKLRVFRTLALVDNSSYKNFTINSAETLSTDNASLENSIRIYPNPADSMLSISSTENQSITSVELYNILGKKVLTTTTKTIYVSKYQTGIYLLKIKTQKGQVTKRIVIQ